MRDLIVTILVLGSLPIILMRPYVGILVWSWLGYMNPHRLTWGFAFSMQFALMVAVTTLIALLLSKEPKRIPWTRETILLLLFVAWMFLTTVLANYPWMAWPQWDKVWRIMLMTFVTLMLITDRHRLHLLVTVIALSLAFYGAKGGFFVLTGGSSHNVRGPLGSFIGDRNSIGLALLMTVPLLRYLQLQTKQMWYRVALTVTIALTLIAIIGTHSRGALVGLAATTLFFLLKTRRKIGAVLLIIPMALVVLYVMPQEWFDRMHTIQTYDDEVAAQGRLYAWGNGIRLANENFFGGGFRAVAGYGGTDSHSIYFGVLGEHGWVGLSMFLLLILFTWRSAAWLMANGRRNPDLYWARDLGSMVQVSLVGYMSAGAFLGLQYFDLFYHLVAIIVIARMLVTQAIKNPSHAEDKVALKKDGSAVEASGLSADSGSPEARDGAPRVRSFVRGE